MIGIPFAVLLSTVFGLFLISLPIGMFVVFESDIGGSINYDFPVTHLEVLRGTDIFRAPIDISIGDVFTAAWIIYVVMFVIAMLGPKNGFIHCISPMISSGHLRPTSNYMLEITKWFSALVLISALIVYVQEGFGVGITSPPAENDLIQFFYISLAPLVEELGFRVILIGIPLFLMYSHRSSARHFLTCLWRPSNLRADDYRKGMLLVVFVAVMFGFAHIAFGESWSEGKFAQATASGVILGWVYLRYGFVAALLIHWATNYFIFSLATFASQINSIPIEEVFTHSLMASVELLLLVTGALSVTVLLINRLAAVQTPDG